MDVSGDSSWGWIQRIALILGALASLIVIVEFPESRDPQPDPPVVVERPAPPSPQLPPPEPEPTIEVESVTATVFRTKHGERYHRPSCHHVRGKAIPLSLAEAKEMGLTPCGTCNPDL